MDLACFVRIFEDLIPLHLAESWDNTGLLVEPPNIKPIETILFTNDLTEAVMHEALSVNANLIISYHPPIFSPIKALKSANWKDRIIMNCIQNAVAVYSPHTACDAVKDGVNSWLLKCFDLIDVQPILQSCEVLSKYSHYVDFSVPQNKDLEVILKSLSDFELNMMSSNENIKCFRVMINKTSLNRIVSILSSQDVSSITLSSLSPLPLPSCGMGRMGKFKQPQKLGVCIDTVKKYLKLKHIRFAYGVSHSFDTEISVVAVCAGSGSSVLKGVHADLYITGEMSHHDLLDANHRNISVILCEHSNSERGYLADLMKDLTPNLTGVNLIMSLCDKDPVSIV